MGSADPLPSQIRWTDQGDVVAQSARKRKMFNKRNDGLGAAWSPRGKRIYLGLEEM